MTIQRLSDIDVRGKRVFIRADLNVPQDDAGAITDDTRIRASVPAIHDALARGAAVMVTSHLGRPAEGRSRRGRQPPIPRPVLHPSRARGRPEPPRRTGHHRA